MVGLRSRFEVDLNRPRDKGGLPYYLKMRGAWRCGRTGFPTSSPQVSGGVRCLLRGGREPFSGDLAARHGRFLVLDLHTYCHRRAGPDSPPADPSENPQVNIGTGTLADRSRWAPLIDRFMNDLGTFDFPGGRLDVRENVKFRGGAFAAWTHRTFPDSACVLSIEFKKFFMDEWTGEPDEVLVERHHPCIEMHATRRPGGAG